MSNLETLHRAVKAYAIIFVLWGMYRLVFRLPESIEETLLKPLVFVGAVMLVERPKHRLRYFIDTWGKGHWARAIAWGLIVGVGLFAFTMGANLFLFQKYLQSGVTQRFWMSVVGISVLTAVWEEWVFVGYLLRALRRVFRDSLLAMIIAAGMFTLVHLPILVFWYRFTPMVVALQLLLFFSLGFGNMLLMGWTNNLLAPIIAHVFWGAAVIILK